MKSLSYYAQSRIISKNVLNFDSNSKGVINEYFLNSMPSIYVVNKYYDDIFEGVCHYKDCHIIDYFIYSMKYFDFNTLNSRKQNFNYEPKKLRIFLQI